MRYAWILVLLILATGSAAADSHYDHIIINSQEWQDVYTGMQYANLVGIPANFLVSTRHSTTLLYSVPVERDVLLVLSSKERPFIVGYEPILQSRGYDSPEEIRSASLNLELLERLEGIDRFIVIDDAYGYNAISIAPYSQADRSFVIFADENNIDEIAAILEEKQPESVLIYGQVDRAVKQQLAPFNPETINLGSRFDNNIEIVRRYLEIKPTRQVILTNGEFIEQGIMSGSDPVLFLGRANVPESVRDFIAESDIDVGILIGNELVNAATFVRRQLGISVFVKFAQGAREPTGSIAQVEDLDRFPMPRYELGIEVTSIVYNRATGALQVTYHNTQNLAEYFKSTLTVRDAGEIRIIGDERAVFLDKNEYKTIIYESDADSEPLNFQSSELEGDAFVIFGESETSLENTYQESFSIDTVEFLDDSEIEIADLYYDTLSGEFVVSIENVGARDAYVSIELVDLLVNGEEVTVGGDGTARIAQGKSAEVMVPVEMAEEDLAENPEVRVRAYYGERELQRIKIKERTFPLETRTGYGTYAVYGTALLLLLIGLGWLGTKKKCRHCGRKNARGKKACEQCGKRF